VTVVTLASLHSASSSPHVGRIEIGPTRRAKGGWAGPVTVVYDGDEWSIELDMIEVYAADMVGFFEEVAHERGSWSGVKSWRSEFDEVELRATNPGNGLVAFRFRLWWAGDDPLDNERAGELHVRADELPVVATRVRQLTELSGEVERLRL
jgi:hypothetical protein